MKDTNIDHNKFMLRCFELALKGLGATYPNPLVGSVIVHQGTIIGEGWHHKAGEAHAEVNAINNVTQKKLLKESTLYVNLEPCNHYGKTPPCAQLIVKHKIPRVVIGTIDPFKEVNGSGITTLEQAGIEVMMSSLGKEAKQINQRFFTFHQKKRPYIVLKWAQSIDGFIAPLTKNRKSKSPVFLSSKEDQVLVHQWRKEEEAILVGAQTIIDDNPRLTSRWVSGRHPIRVILDPRGRIPQDAQVFSSDSPTHHLTYPTLGMKGNESPEEFLLRSLEYLYHQNINSVLIEGGKKTIDFFIKASLWDEARVFKSPIKLTEGIPAPEGISLKSSKQKNLIIVQPPKKQL